MSIVIKGKINLFRCFGVCYRVIFLAFAGGTTALSLPTGVSDNQRSMSGSCRDLVGLPQDSQTLPVFTESAFSATSVCSFQTKYIYIIQTYTSTDFYFHYSDL